MSNLRSMIVAATLALSASAAVAQTSGLTNGPNGMQPNTLGSDNASNGINAKAPSRAIMNRHSTMYNSGAMLIHRHRHRRNYRHHYLQR